MALDVAVGSARKSHTNHNKSDRGRQDKLPPAFAKTPNLVSIRIPTTLQVGNLKRKNLKFDQ